MIKLYKKIGETPLQALQRLRQQSSELADERLSYAGRLDPMAAGVLPVLVGEENDHREAYLEADKSYTFELLFGVETDTFDLLGLPTLSLDDNEFCRRGGKEEGLHLLRTVNDTNVPLTVRRLQSVCDNLVGEYEMEYPPYSSKTVTLDGTKTSLWEVARAGQLDEVTIPTKEVTIQELSCVEVETVSKNYIISYIINYVGKLEGDFRQEEIITSWKQALNSDQAQDSFLRSKHRLRCSSGTYVRQLSQKIGGQVEHPAVAFSVLRTRVK